MDLKVKMFILLVLNTFMFRNFLCICLVYYSYLSRVGNHHPRLRISGPRRWSLILKMNDQSNYLRDIVEQSDKSCIDNLRMDRRTFFRLCHLLENMGGLHSERFVTVPEKVAIFLLVIAHHTKNVIAKHNFKRSGQTISKVFNQTLRAVIKISHLLLVEPKPVEENCTTEPWKYFKGCLGALDGTYVKVRVRHNDQKRYRSRKGDTAVNVLGVVNRDMNFIYVLTGWEGSAADCRVLRDALHRPHGLRVPHGNYYLCDCGYANAEGFLTPYRGTRYHLEDWRNGANSPQNPKELFNLKHSKARNIVERAFGLLKIRWAVLRSPTFYHIKEQNLIILACALLHNFIRTQMDNDPLADSLDNGGSMNHDNDNFVDSIEPSNLWSQWRDNLATEMWNAWTG